MIRLVLAGSHQQYLDWLGDGGRSPGDYRPLRFPDDFRGLDAHLIASLDLVGTFWHNPAWGSHPYRELMVDGLNLDAHWAWPWGADYLRAETLRDAYRNPVSPAELAAAAERQRAMEEMLNG